MHAISVGHTAVALALISSPHIDINHVDVSNNILTPLLPPPMFSYYWLDIFCPSVA